MTATNGSLEGLATIARQFHWQVARRNSPPRAVGTIEYSKLWTVCFLRTRPRLEAPGCCRMCLQDMQSGTGLEG